MRSIIRMYVSVVCAASTSACTSSPRKSTDAVSPSALSFATASSALSTVSPATNRRARKNRRRCSPGRLLRTSAIVAMSHGGYHAAAPRAFGRSPAPGDRTEHAMAKAATDVHAQPAPAHGLSSGELTTLRLLQATFSPTECDVDTAAAQVVDALGLLTAHKRE